MIFQDKKGQKLSYEVFGDPAGIPLVFFHGFPGSKIQGLLADEEGKKNGIKIISTDRPGYGDSDFIPERTLLGFAVQIDELMTSLNHAKYYMIGVSGGAPYALACAHELKEKILGLALICPLGPIFEIQYRRKFSFFSKTFFFLARSRPQLFTRLYGKMVRTFDRNPEKFFRTAALRLDASDRKIIKNQDFQNILRTSFANSYKQSYTHAALDMVLYNSPWGFQLTNITTSTQIWHGKQDKVVPYQVSEALQRELKNSSLTLCPDDGHYSLPVLYIKNIIDSLVQNEKVNA